MFKPPATLGFTEANILNPSLASLYVALYLGLKNSMKKDSNIHFRIFFKI